MRKPTNKTALLGSLLLAGVALFASGCGLATVSQAQRADIAQRMTGASVPLAKCYSDVLATTPEATGNVVVSFRAQPNTGRFTNVKLVRSEIKDPAFTKCVLGVVGDLHMSAPDFTIDVTEYTIAFKPAAP